MCEAEGSTSEHVPQRAIFPEAKDAGGGNFRLDLITVPSCELHNMGKSHDDEFLMVSLAGILGNNSIGYQHKFTKVNRAIKRSSYKLLTQAFVRKPTLHTIDLGNNKFIDILWGTPDHARLSRCFERISRGLYYHHFDAPFSGQIKVLMGFLSYDEGPSKNLNQFLVDRAELDLVQKDRFGKNQDAFYYQVVGPDEHGLYLFRLCFYGGISIFASLIPDTSNMPTHLGIELMKRGIKTVFTLGERSYEVDFGDQGSAAEDAAADKGEQ